MCGNSSLPIVFILMRRVTGVKEDGDVVSDVAVEAGADLAKRCANSEGNNVCELDLVKLINVEDSDSCAAFDVGIVGGGLGVCRSLSICNGESISLIEMSCC